MGLKPPQHRAGVRHIMISDEDDAWDHDAIEADIAKMTKAGENTDDHPVNVYRVGDSRFDLGAKYPVCGDLKSAQDYLKSEADPTEFELIPLRLKEFARARDIAARQGTQEAYLYCAKHGLQDCEGLRLPTTGNGRAKRVSSKGLDMLSEVSMDLPTEVGAAIYLLSQGPSEAEKKRSGS